MWAQLPADEELHQTQAAGSAAAASSSPRPLGLPAATQMQQQRGCSCPLAGSYAHTPADKLGTERSSVIVGTAPSCLAPTQAHGLKRLLATTLGHCISDQEKQIKTVIF